jgi:hypothetical protein
MIINWTTELTNWFSKSQQNMSWPKIAVIWANCQTVHTLIITSKRRVFAQGVQVVFDVFYNTTQMQTHSQSIAVLYKKQ